MSQQEKNPQQEQTYTFEDICPEWTQIISQNGGFVQARKSVYTSGVARRDITSCYTCIVGEAHSA